MYWVQSNHTKINLIINLEDVSHLIASNDIEKYD